MVLRRRVARVVLLDPDQRVLLIRSSDPGAARPGGRFGGRPGGRSDVPASWWELPGGGLEPGESPSEAAARELWEETGLTADSISAPVWLQHVAFTFAGMDFDQDESVHLAWGQGGEYRPAGLEGIEAAAMHEGRWWPLDEVVTSFGPGGLRIIPVWLPHLLPAVLADGIPGTPVDLGHVE